jgi:hypothetical protein
MPIRLLIMGMCVAAIFHPIRALNVDMDPQSPAAATAASEFLRCVIGAGGVALVNSMLNN